jgi:protein-tyrosine-phosphatase
MAEDGVDITDQASTCLSDAMLNRADRVITVCGHADGHCPGLPPGARKEHWPLEDPVNESEPDSAPATVSITVDVTGPVGVFQHDFEADQGGSPILFAI